MYINPIIPQNSNFVKKMDSFFVLQELLGLLQFSMFIF